MPFERCEAGYVLLDNFVRCSDMERSSFAIAGLLSLALSVACTVQAQSVLDTIVLSKAECGMRYNVYLWHLFHGRGPSSYGYRPRTAQDRWFLDTMPQHYYLVFLDRKGRKLFEGCVNWGQMNGLVNFHRADGSLRRTEHWGFDGDLQAAPELEWSDVEHEVGTWTYFDKRGRLRKEERYGTLAMHRSNRVVCYRVKVTVRFSRKGPWKRERIALLDSTE